MSQQQQISPRGALRRLWQIVKPRWPQALGLSLLLTLTAALTALWPQFVRLTIDVLIPRGDAGLFWLMGLGVTVFYLLVAGLGYVAMYYSYAFTQSVISGVRLEAYGRLLTLPLTRFTQERSGSLVSRVVSDVNALETMIQSGASRLLGQLFSVVIILVVLFRDELAVGADRPCHHRTDGVLYRTLSGAAARTRRGAFGSASGS